MKRYRFRLEQVARVRRIQEEQARANLLAARKRMIEAEEEIAKRAGDLEEKRSRSTTGPGSRFRSEREVDERLAKAVTAAKLAEANAHLVLGQRAAEWADTARAVSSLDRLDERMRAEHAAQEARQEQRELDDLVASRPVEDSEEGEP